MVGILRKIPPGLSPNSIKTSAITEFRKALRINYLDNSARISLINSYLARATYYANQEKNYEKAANDFRSALFYLKIYPTKEQAIQNSSGMIALVKKEYVDLSLDKNNYEKVLVIDSIEIPGNVGTILRASDGANIDAVFLCNRRARITHPKIIKGSMGAAFTKPIVEFESVEECKAWLKKKNFKIYLTDTRATKTYFEDDYEGRVALIVGSERYGITKPWYDGDYEMIMIPMLGQCDSLNVAIATTIIAYEASLKQKGFMKGVKR